MWRVVGKLLVSSLPRLHVVMVVAFVAVIVIVVGVVDILLTQIKSNQIQFSLLHFSSPLTMSPYHPICWLYWMAFIVV